MRPARLLAEGRPAAVAQGWTAARRHAPLLVGLGVMLVYAVYVAWRLRTTGSDPSFFVVAGPLATDPAATLPNLHVFPSGTTYDGQFFYRLALEPWTNVVTAYGIQLDVPAYRQQRILYPLLAWLLSAGRWQLTPAALIVTNLLAVGVLAYATAAFAVGVGRSALAAVLVPFYPGYLVSISRDLAELVEAALLAVGLLLVQRRHFWSASLALTLGMLAKETLLGVPIAGCLWWAWTRLRRAGGQAFPAGPPLLVWLVPLAAYALWSAVLQLRWGTTGLGQGAVNFGAPFAALVEHLASLGTPSWLANRDEIGALGLVAFALAALAVSFRTHLADPGAVSFRTHLADARALPLASLVYAALAVCYASYVWHDDYAYLRALHELFLTAALALLPASVRATRGLGLATLLVWLSFAVQHGQAP